jgi:hypothetical protein
MNQVKYQNEKGEITLEQNSDGTYRLYGSRGTAWREWTATTGEIPTISAFFLQFEALADTIISGIGKQ